jgi:hypothetical protein
MIVFLDKNIITFGNNIYYSPIDIDYKTYKYNLKSINYPHNTVCITFSNKNTKFDINYVLDNITPLKNKIKEVDKLKVYIAKGLILMGICISFGLAFL